MPVEFLVLITELTGTEDFTEEVGETTVILTLDPTVWTWTEIEQFYTTTITYKVRIESDYLADLEQTVEIDPVRFPVAVHPGHIEPVDPADHFIQCAETHFGHDRAQFLGHEEHVIDHVFGRAGKARAQHRILAVSYTHLTLPTIA